MKNLLTQQACHGGGGGKPSESWGRKTTGPGLIFLGIRWTAGLPVSALRCLRRPLTQGRYFFCERREMLKFKVNHSSEADSAITVAGFSIFLYFLGECQALFAQCQALGPGIAPYMRKTREPEAGSNA